MASNRTPSAPSAEDRRRLLPGATSQLFGLAPVQVTERHRVPLRISVIQLHLHDEQMGDGRRLAPSGAAGDGAGTGCVSTTLVAAMVRAFCTNHRRSADRREESLELRRRAVREKIVPLGRRPQELRSGDGLGASDSSKNQ